MAQEVTNDVRLYRAMAALRKALPNGHPQIIENKQTNKQFEKVIAQIDKCIIMGDKLNVMNKAVYNGIRKNIAAQIKEKGLDHFAMIGQRTAEEDSYMFMVDGVLYIIRDRHYGSNYTRHYTYLFTLDNNRSRLDKKWCIRVGLWK